MANTKFAIPSEFKDQLRYAESLDKRSDDEILNSLTNFAPVTSEKNIWAFWHAGILEMPAWCKRNIINWARLCGPSWSIRVLDTVPNSPNHALKYIEPDMLPETFVEGTMEGPYIGPHSADFLRGACIYRYGGVFMDICVPWMHGTVIANHFIAARKEDPFIKRWHDLFVYLWKDKTSHDGVSQSPLVAFSQNLDFSESQRRGYAWEFIVGPLTVFEYITQVVAWIRLCMLEDAGDGFSCTDYAKDHILWFDSLEEDWGAETVVGFRGKEFFDALAMKLSADTNSKEYKTAYKLVWRLLTRSSMQKITHGKHLTKTPALGLLWDEDENEGKDNELGTFAELLRYGSVHFEQTREEISFVKPEISETMKKGVFEP